MIDPHIHAAALLKAVAAKTEDLASFKISTVAGPPCPVDLRSPGATYTRPSGIDMSIFVRPIDATTPAIGCDEAARITSADLLAIGKLERETWKVLSLTSDFIPHIQYEAVFTAAAANLSEHRDLVWEWLFGGNVSFVAHFHQLDMFRTEPTDGLSMRAALVMASRVVTETAAVQQRIAQEFGVESGSFPALVQAMARLGATGEGSMELEARLDAIRSDLHDMVTEDLEVLGNMSRAARLAKLRAVDSVGLLDLARRMVKVKQIDASVMLLSRAGLIERIDFALAGIPGGDEDQEGATIANITDVFQAVVDAEGGSVTVTTGMGSRVISRAEKALEGVDK